MKKAFKIILSLFVVISLAACTNVSAKNNLKNKIENKDKSMVEYKESDVEKAMADKMKANSSMEIEKMKNTDTKTIYLAGGCFWVVESYMQKISGVVDDESGYANGNT